MKRLLLVAGTIGLAFSAAAQTFTDHARVRSVEPQYETIQVPRQECRWSGYQDRAPADQVNYAGVALGAVAGGVLGNQIGRGHGREAATAAGAAIGALTGDRLASIRGRSDYAARGAQYCYDIAEPRTQVVGYRVHYVYHGIEQVALMREAPGATIPVQVSVVPASEDGRWRTWR